MQRLMVAIAVSVAAFVLVMLGALGAYLLAGTHGAQALTTQANNATLPQQLPPSAMQQAPQTGGSDSAGNYAVNADQAANIALSTVPGSSLMQQPRLVSVNGTVAYEVTLNQGLVYIDATSGQVLYNGVNGTITRPRQRFRR